MCRRLILSKRKELRGLSDVRHEISCQQDATLMLFVDFDARVNKEQTGISKSGHAEVHHWCKVTTQQLMTAYETRFVAGISS